MTLQVIGAGFGRTGTLSLKNALEMLGFDPCHHMEDVIKNPAQGPLWQAAAEDPMFDWEQLLAGYGAAVDWPACFFWQQLAAYYPQAKVILSLRDGDSWYQSVLNTIYHAMVPSEELSVPLPKEQLAMVRDLIRDRTFSNRLNDKAHVIKVYEAHNDAVCAAIPAERLLSFNVREGWEPLCRFLEIEIPDAPFPRVNSTEDFRKKTASKR